MSPNTLMILCILEKVIIIKMKNAALIPNKTELAITSYLIFILHCGPIIIKFSENLLLQPKLQVIKKN